MAFGRIHRSVHLIVPHESYAEKAPIHLRGRGGCFGGTQVIPDSVTVIAACNRALAFRYPSSFPLQRGRDHRVRTSNAGRVLLNRVIGHRMDVILVDNGSTDRLRKSLKPRRLGGGRRHAAFRLSEAKLPAMRSRPGLQFGRRPIGLACSTIENGTSFIAGPGGTADRTKSSWRRKRADPTINIIAPIVAS